MKKQIAERVGSGNKMEVKLHEYGKSTHNLSKIRRTSMTTGTLVPMGTWIMLPGDSAKMYIDALITTNALEYQLYGTMKFQVDVFTARMALYQPKMSLNLLDAGLEVQDIKFPQMEVEAERIDWNKNPSHQQINPSAAMAYYGISAVGDHSDPEATGTVKRHFHAMWKLMYTDIYKEFYANKQEGIGVVIHTVGAIQTIGNVYNGDGSKPLPQLPATTTGIQAGESLKFYMVTALDKPDPEELGVQLEGQPYRAVDVWTQVNIYEESTNTVYEFIYAKSEYMNRNVDAWFYYSPESGTMPKLKTFDLKNVDKMRMKLLASVEEEGAFVIDSTSLEPYSLDLKKVGNVWSKTISQEGLFIKTYQSDVFNNWLNVIWINNINNRSKVSTATGGFTIDSLLIMQKSWNYFNRIAVADGTLDGWREVTYAHKSSSKSLKPVYEGGLSKEIVFDMVVSTAATEAEPLGSIASRGQLGSKHKGGRVEINTDEESLLMVIASITPRIVYTQGNRWDVNLRSLDDLHKPEFDRIGFQNLITDQMAGWDTRVVSETELATKAAGKQPAWMWYKTDYDDAFGNMATTESYKVLGRNYGWNAELRSIQDLTTYIDPVKFNEIFAIKSLDAMNFDVQVGMDLEMRRIISAEEMPNM